MTAFELRIPSPADADAWFALFDDPAVMRYIGDGRLQPREWYQAFALRQRVLAEETGLCLFALLRSDVAGAGEGQGGAGGAGRSADPPLPHSVVAGFVGLQPWTAPWGPTGRIEIGWRLGAAHQGLGLATAAAEECLVKAAAAGIREPVAMIDVQNRASIAVAERLAMEKLDEVGSPSGARVAVYGFDTSEHRAPARP